MNNKTLCLLGVLAIVLIALYTGMGQDILDPNSKTVTAFGQNWTLSAPWGNSGYLCNGYPPVITTDKSTSTMIFVYATLPNTGRRVCSKYSVGVTIKLNLDLSKYEKVVIRRSATLRSSSGSYNAALSSTVMGMTFSESDFDGRTDYGHVGEEFGAIYITNDGTSIKVVTDEGTKLFDADKPLYFDASATISEGSDTREGTLDYKITGLELTPLKNTIPDTTNDPVGWFQALLNAIIAFIKEVLS